MIKDNDAMVKIEMIFAQRLDPAPLLFCKTELIVSQAHNETTYEVARKNCPLLKKTHALPENLRKYIDGTASYFEYEK